MFGGLRIKHFIGEDIDVFILVLTPISIDIINIYVGAKPFKIFHRFLRAHGYR